MPQLLLEILTEEIPARMQAKAEADLSRALLDRLGAAGLLPEGVKGFSGPRRIAAVVEGLPARSKDVEEEIKGPKVGAPEPAIQGFLRKAGLFGIEAAEVQPDKKGDFYVARIRKEGRATAELIAEMVPALIREFHWPKSMRWGEGDLYWVRPIQRILCTFDGEVVPFEIGGLRSGNVTEGHRVMGRGPFTVRRWDDYAETLKNKGRVLLDREERREIILSEARQLCHAQNLELVEDPGLLEEVTGLAEWPQVIIGDMDPAFLDLPPEVIRLSMRTHQKYFAVRDPAKGEGRLAPKFIVVANLVAKDGGARIAAGNARVLSARLNDARFFWNNDRRVKLEDRFGKLASIVFHEKLGSVQDKARRVMALARELAPFVGADPDMAERAARLAKCDLVSDMVGEFPELEGVMGRYYALEQGEPAEIANAIRDHYKPKGPGDDIPSAPVSVAVALADKFDTLAGFWAIDEKPTGSKDPFALRRAALGVIRLILTAGVRVSLDRVHDAHIFLHQARNEVSANDQPLMARLYAAIVQNGVMSAAVTAIMDQVGRSPPAWVDAVRNHDPSISDDLRAFFHDRLKVHLREDGVRHDHIDACMAMEGSCDLVLVVKRVEALGAFLETEDGKNLLAGYKRAVNILRIEEKKDGADYARAAEPGLFALPEEKELARTLAHVAPAATAALEKEDFAAAMRALSTLRGPVDAFFDKVTVNADERDVRANRLRLLSQIRDALHRVADFGKVEG